MCDMQVLKKIQSPLKHRNTVNFFNVAIFIVGKKIY